MHLDGGMEHAAARNAILVIVSVVIDGKASRLTRALRLLSKLLSITVFVVGTAFFSSAQLLAPTMAVMVLTILLAAAVFSRAIASFIISAVERSEPMIHVLVHS